MRNLVGFYKVHPFRFIAMLVGVVVIVKTVREQSSVCK